MTPTNPSRLTPPRTAVLALLGLAAGAPLLLTACGTDAAQAAAALGPQAPQVSVAEVLEREITNFQELVVHRGRKRKTISCSSKGHAEELAAWAQFLRGHAGHPLPYEESRASMQLAFAVLESIQKAASVEVGTKGV